MEVSSSQKAAVKEEPPPGCSGKGLCQHPTCFSAERLAVFTLGQHAIPGLPPPPFNRGYFGFTVRNVTPILNTGGSLLVSLK